MDRPFGGGIGDVEKIAMWIANAAEAVPTNRKQCVRLSNRVDDLCKTLKDVPSLPYGQLKAVKSLLETILGYVRELQGKSFLEQFLRHGDVTTRLQGFNSELTSLATDLNVALAIDERLDRAARDADAAAFHSTLMEALAKMIQQGTSGHKSSAQFATRAYRTLLSQSGESPSRVEDWIITEYEIEKGELIAQGGFGKVYRGMMDGHTEVAIKELMDGDIDRAKWVSEVEIWCSLRHPFILPLLGAGKSANLPFMVCKYMANGTLRQ
ncbi:hypothetical protein HDV00_009123 [Rhizophlyctis rosea]|nr:hypothetical protein HDV00_009123 [Rhizophlyctis rosea]